MNNLIDYAKVNSAALGLSAADVTLLNTTQTNWGTAYSAHIASQAAAQGARAAKDNVRATSETTIRTILRQLQASPQVDDQGKESMGITVADEGRTPVPVPSTPPTAIINAAQRLQHTIDFRDATNSASRGAGRGNLDGDHGGGCGGSDRPVRFSVRGDGYGFALRDGVLRR
jgi:hypothetical protein